jgi:hypothetical protein
MSLETPIKIRMLQRKLYQRAKEEQREQASGKEHVRPAPQILWGKKFSTGRKNRRGFSPYLVRAKKPQ